MKIEETSYRYPVSILPLLEETNILQGQGDMIKSQSISQE